MSGPVVFGYDGSELVQAAIANAGRHLPAHRDALVVTTGVCGVAGGVVSRPGLFARLGASTRVTVVSAPPGTGKTVRSWPRWPRLRLIPAPD